MINSLLLGAVAFHNYKESIKPQTVEDFETTDAANTLGGPFADLNIFQEGMLFAGIGYGIITNEFYASLDQCTTALNAEVDLALSAWDDVIVKHSVISIPRGIIEAKNAVEDIPYTIGQCRIIHDEIIIIKEWLADLAHQEELEQLIKHNVKTHLVALTRDLHQAQKLYADGQYWQCGIEVGNMIVIATTV